MCLPPFECLCWASLLMHLKLYSRPAVNPDCLWPALAWNTRDLGIILSPAVSPSLCVCVWVAQQGLTLATPWILAHQAPLSVEFSRQKYWSGLPFSSSGDLPNPGIEPRCPMLQVDSLQFEVPGKPFLPLIETQLTGPGAEWSCHLSGSSSFIFQLGFPYLL